MPLSKDLREFVALLNSNEVEYLIVGAFAVAYQLSLTMDIPAIPPTSTSWCDPRSKTPIGS